jgi:hypothetical protein
MRGRAADEKAEAKVGLSEETEAAILKILQGES